MTPKPKINIIAAIGSGDRAIGRNNQLLWQIPDDLKRFKKLTQGHPVIMGRKTFESILDVLGQPLPNRTNIVITHQADYQARDVITVNSVDKALSQAKALDDREVFIIGGQQIYQQTLDQADRLYLTVVESDQEGDAWFPDYDKIFNKITELQKMKHGELEYAWITLEK